jgi:hypothetical protein
VRRDLLGVLERATAPKVGGDAVTPKVWQPIGVGMLATCERRRIICQASA